MKAIRDSQPHSPLRSRQRFASVSRHLPASPPWCCQAAGQSATIGTLMHAHNNHKLINAYEKKTTVVRISIFLNATKRVEGAWQEIGLVGGFSFGPKQKQVKSQDTGGRGVGVFY